MLARPTLLVQSPVTTGGILSAQGAAASKAAAARNTIASCRRRPTIWSPTGMPLLVLTGLKFVLEDFRAGRPATLFLGFALYGLALIVGPRLCRRPGSPEGAAPGRRPS